MTQATSAVTTEAIKALAEAEAAMRQARTHLRALNAAGAFSDAEDVEDFGKATLGICRLLPLFDHLRFRIGAAEQ